MVFTKEELLASKEYKHWIHETSETLIHNVYHDGANPEFAAWIVVHIDLCGKWDIVRFFKGGGKIHVSVDHTGKTSTEVFALLLSEYSRGLD